MKNAFHGQTETVKESMRLKTDQQKLPKMECKGKRQKEKETEHYRTLEKF